MKRVSSGRGERTSTRRAPARVTRDQQERDQQESSFTAILGDLVARIPGARAAALVDVEGETVDYAGALRPFDARLAAAHWRIVLDETAAQRSLRCVRFVTVRASRGSYLVRALPDGYALVVVLARVAGFARWERAVAGATWALSVEAGWGTAVDPPPWFPVQVACDRRRRPVSVRVGGLERPLEILGAVVPRELARGERGWRVRLGTRTDASGIERRGDTNVDASGIANHAGPRGLAGDVDASRIAKDRDPRRLTSDIDAGRIASDIEATLVREAGGAWYADEPLDHVEKGLRKNSLTGRPS